MKILLSSLPHFAKSMTRTLLPFVKTLMCYVIIIFYGSRIGGVTIMRKGKEDLISDGKTGIRKSLLSWLNVLKCSSQIALLCFDYISEL